MRVLRVYMYIYIQIIHTDYTHAYYTCTHIHKCHKIHLQGQTHTRTFGKGVVQTVSPLFDGSGVAVTIAKYETPNKIGINKKGIEVDSEDTSKMCPDPYPGL